MLTVDLNLTPYLEGNFSSYEAALRAAEKIQPDLAGGYGSMKILERVANSIQMVRRGEAAFERDGVAFAHEEYRRPFLAALLYVMMREQKLSVLDFGGSLGSSYFQNRKFLYDVPLEWNVVEQKHFVEYGRKNIPEVNFYSKIAQCRNKNINCVIASSSLNYVDAPYDYLNELLNIDAKYFILDITYFNTEWKDRILLEHVPESIYRAIYPITLPNVDKFGKLLLQNYHMIFYLPADNTMPLVEGNTARITPCHGWLLEHD